MERKVWLFAAVGFAGALAMYKTSAQHATFNEDGRLGRLARLEALMDEGKTQYRPSFFRKKVQAHIIEEQVAGLSPKPSSEVKAPTADEAAKKKAEADKKAAEEKKKADDKKKKDEEAKKKKKKKKKDDAAKRTNDAAPDVSSDDKKPSDPSTGGDAGGGAATGGIGHYNPNKNPESVDEWIAYLLNNPTFEKTTKFIQLKQIGTISDDVFYPVIAKMLTINTDTVRGYAVMALGATPSLLSLEALFSVKNGAPYDDQVKQQVLHYLQIFRRVDYVQILASAAGVPNNLLLNEFAISEIRQSLAINLAPSDSPSESSNGGPASRSPASNTAKRYQAIATVLQNIASTTTDSGIQSSAAALAAQIETQIGQNLAANN